MKTLDYLQQLKAEFDNGKLLMDCILPSFYDELVQAGMIRALDFMPFMDDASKYLQLWNLKHPRRLNDDRQRTVEEMQNHARQQDIIRMDIAKKLAIYDLVREYKP